MNMDSDVDMYVDMYVDVDTGMYVDVGAGVDADVYVVADVCAGMHAGRGCRCECGLGRE